MGHEVPALFGASALNTQTNEASQGSLTVGTSALLSAKVTGYNTHVVPGYHLIGKREAEAEPAVVLPYAGLAGYPYAGVGYPYAAVAPAVTYAVPKVETKVTATNAAVPVAVGGYKAVAGDNGELKGAVHEVPALFGPPALNTQTNEASQGSLTVGTSAVITHTVGEPIVNEHTINVPTYGVYGGIYGKREAEPFLAYGALPYAGHLGYGLPAVFPATHEVTYKTITPTVETNVVATNLPVPVAVGGYKAVAGDNGDLKG